MKKTDVQELIVNGENSRVEFKRDDIRPEQLAREVVALANGWGGHILLGVEDDGTISGISRSNLGEWVADTVFGRYIHPIILPYYEEVLMDSGKRIAIITIGTEVSKPYVVRANDRETAYVRISAVTRSATREQLLMLGAAGGSVHTEIMPVNRSDFESLDLARLENYLRDILKDPDVPLSTGEWIKRLKALGFMTDGPGGSSVCTIAGLVLFGVSPRQLLKQAGVRMMFFDSLDKKYQALLDKILDGPMVGRFRVGKGGKTLIDAGLIEKCLDTMEPFSTWEPDEVDAHFRREKQWLYPFEAIRELLINALVHRDWTRFVDVEIAGYQDRLEITSPGPLPNSMTIEKVLAGQRSPRNTLMVEVMRDYGYVDARGMGIRTKVMPLFPGLKAQSIFIVTDDYVRVTLEKMSVKDDADRNKDHKKRRESVGKASEKPSSRVGKTADKILTAIHHHNTITIQELADLVGVTQRSIERNLRKLQQAGLLKRVGGRKQGHWEVQGK